MRGLILVATLLAGSASAQAPSPTANLDALLAAKDYRGLGAAVTHPADAQAFRTNLDWLRDSMVAGASTMVALLYARVLWASTENATEPGRTALRETAVMATLYGYGAVGIDGARCRDRTAPDHRRLQLLSINPGLLDFYRAMPPDRRQLVIRGAVTIEARTAALRDAAGDDAFACTAGMEEMSYNLAHGTTRERPAEPGEVGRQIEVTGDGSYRPGVRPAAEWRPEAQKARADLPATLATLAGAPQVSSPPPRR